LSLQRAGTLRRRRRKEEEEDMEAEETKSYARAD